MSKPWKLDIGRQPQKALRRLPRPVRQRIDEAILGLADDPHPAGCRPVKTAATGTYRVRVGDYRVIYTYPLNILGPGSPCGMDASTC